MTVSYRVVYSDTVVPWLIYELVFRNITIADLTAHSLYNRIFAFSTIHYYGIYTLFIFVIVPLSITILVLFGEKLYSIPESSVRKSPG